MDREVLVYADLGGVPIVVGRLWSRVRKGRESATFEYDDQWLNHPERFALEPASAWGWPSAHSCRPLALRGTWRFCARSLGPIAHAPGRADAGRTRGQGSTDAV
jgi:hypothetical protein